MKNKLNWFMLVVGLFLIVSAIILTFTGAEVLNIPFIRMDLVPITIGFWGSILFIVGFICFFEEKKGTKKQSILEKDERIIMIKQNAKSKAFNLLISLFSVGLLTLALLGYLNEVSFFSLVALYFIGLGYYVFQIWKNSKAM